MRRAGRRRPAAGVAGGRGRRGPPSGRRRLATPGWRGDGVAGRRRRSAADSVPPTTPARRPSAASVVMVTVTGSGSVDRSRAQRRVAAGRVALGARVATARLRTLKAAVGALRVDARDRRHLARGLGDLAGAAPGRSSGRGRHSGPAAERPAGSHRARHVGPPRCNPRAVRDQPRWSVIRPRLRRPVPSHHPSAAHQQDHVDQGHQHHRPEDRHRPTPRPARAPAYQLSGGTTTAAATAAQPGPRRRPGRPEDQGAVAREQQPGGGDRGPAAPSRCGRPRTPVRASSARSGSTLAKCAPAPSSAPAATSQAGGRGARAAPAPRRRAAPERDGVRQHRDRGGLQRPVVEQRGDQREGRGRTPRPVVVSASSGTATAATAATPDRPARRPRRRRRVCRCRPTRASRSASSESLVQPRRAGWRSEGGATATTAGRSWPTPHGEQRRPPRSPRPPVPDGGA